MKPLTKATLVTIIFAAAGLFALLFRAPVSSVLLPQLIFFVVLLVNTFFSVRFYSALQPDDMQQKVIDALLGIVYLALALSLGRAESFAIAALVLFALAPIKYALMFGKISHRALLRRKIIIDLIGTAACAGLLFCTLNGYSFDGAWTFAIAFTLANVYLLHIKPMYKL